MISARLLGHALKSPLWLAQLATGAKSFVDNPILGSERLNRAGLHTLRVRLAHAMADLRRRQIAHLVSPQDRADFARDGFIRRADFMPADLHRAVFAEVTSVAAQGREQVQGDTVTRRIPLDPETLGRMPAMRRLLDLPEWKNLLRYVASFNCEPILTVQTILSHVTDAPPDPQTNFHIDTFHPTMKAWLFLNDVAADEGPFTYVPGSHRLTKRRLAWERRTAVNAASGVDRLSGRGSFRATRAELKRMGYREPVAFAVPGNTLVVGDTVGFHARGPSLRPAVRIEVWAYDRHNPFLPLAGFDLWSLTGLARWRTRIEWWLLDRLEQLGLRRNVWRPVGALGRRAAEDRVTGTLIAFMVANPATSHAMTASLETAGMAAAMIGLRGPRPEATAALVVSTYYYGREAGQREHDVRHAGWDAVQAHLGAEFLYGWSLPNLQQWVAPTCAAWAVAAAIYMFRARRPRQLADSR